MTPFAPIHASGEPNVSVLLVAWNSAGCIAECLRSVVSQNTSRSLEVIVVDNASSDRTAQIVHDDFTRAILIQTNSNTGFAPAMNQAIKRAAGRYLFLLNPDTHLESDVVETLASFLERHPECGGVGPGIVDETGAPAIFAAREFPSLGNAFLRQLGLRELLAGSRFFGREALGGLRVAEPQEVPCLTGAALMLPKNVTEQIGALDEQLPMYFEDLDYCARVRRAGWSLYFAPSARVMHIGGKSSSVSPARRLLLAMENAEAPWLFLRRYAGPWQAAAFRVLVAVGAVVRLALLAFAAGVGLRLGGRSFQLRKLNSIALLDWALAGRRRLYRHMSQYFAPHREEPA